MAKDPSRPARGAWIEILPGSEDWTSRESRPARGAWIEIRILTDLSKKLFVAPRKGRVD